MPLHLPRRPRSVRTLSNEQRERADRITFCPTCGKAGSFEWYVYSSVEWQKAHRQAPPDKKPRPDQVRTYECPCDDQYALARWLGYWGIKKLYQTASWRDIASPEVLSVYKTCIDNLSYYVQTGSGLYIQGGHGLGKSLVCALIAKEAIKAGHLVRFSTFVDLLAQHESTYKGNQTEEAKRWFREEVQDVDLLVIDDLGRENQMNAPSHVVVQRLVSELIRQRDQRGKSTFVSANLFAHKIDERYGTDVGSLVDGNFDVVTLQGEDYRNQLAARRATERRLKLTRPILI